MVKNVPSGRRQRSTDLILGWKIHEWQPTPGLLRRRIPWKEGLVRYEAAVHGQEPEGGQSGCKQGQALKLK